MTLYDAEETTPLLPRSDYRDDGVHDQFCRLVGVPPSDLEGGERKWRSPERSLYARAVRQRRRQSCTYQITATISNVLLLSQVVLGAAVTGLGASNSSHTIITVLGAANTIIAGLVAYLKSRGQPMRARMFRDDLERVVDEIENSEIMWLGIGKGINGYDEIDTDDQVTVRSEVARLTRLYDKAVRNNTLNNPDMYGSGDGLNFMQAALKSRTLPSSTQAPVSQPGPNTAPAPSAPAADSSSAAQVPAIVPVAADPDESPATAKPTPPTAIKVVAPDDKKGDDSKGDSDSKNGNGKDSDASNKDDKDSKDKNDKDESTKTSSGTDNKTQDKAKDKKIDPTLQHAESDEEEQDSDGDERKEAETAVNKGKGRVPPVVADSQSAAKRPTANGEASDSEEEEDNEDSDDGVGRKHAAANQKGR